MQVEGNELFGKRALYYLAKSYVGQIRKAEKYKELKPAYFVGILNFNMFEGDSYITRHILINQENGRQDLKDFEFNFIELKKYNKTENELFSVIDKWIFFLKNAEELQIIPEIITEPEIKEAFDTANQMKWTEEELNIYDYWSGKEGDKIAQIITAKNKGIVKGKAEGKAEGLAEGLEKGLEKGRKEQSIKIAKKLLEILDAKTIAEKTGLSIAEIDKMKQDND
jgi:predicted transposase/invertase (TIGR01784 family)